MHLDVSIKKHITQTNLNQDNCNIHKMLFYCYYLFYLFVCACSSVSCSAYTQLVLVVTAFSYLQIFYCFFLKYSI